MAQKYRIEKYLLIICILNTVSLYNSQYCILTQYMHIVYRVIHLYIHTPDDNPLHVEICRSELSNK
jgi:hypothetical protein